MATTGGQARWIDRSALDGRRGWAEQPAPNAIGDQARLLHTSDTSVFGSDSREAYAVQWRDGNLVIIVLVAGLDGDTGVRAALECAAKQHDRQQNPTTTAPGENDDLEVPLDRPSLSVPVYWLGRDFAPPGDLPPLQLAYTWGPIRPGGGPGLSVELEYTQRVKIEIWEPPKWAQFTATDLGRMIWDSPCAEATEVLPEGGRAVIYGGYVGIVEGLGPASSRERYRLFAGPDCPTERPDRYLAHVYFDDAVVTVNIPFAWSSVEWYSDVDHPYYSVSGLEAIVRGLRRR